LNAPFTYHEAPFFRLVIPLILGIALQFKFQILPANQNTALLPLVIFIFLAISFAVVSQWRYRWVYGLMLNTFILACGLTLSLNLTFSDNLEAEKETKVIARLLDNPQQRAKSIKVKCKVESILTNQGLVNSEESILIYFELSDSMAQRLTYGDIIATKITPTQFESPKNPYQFDIGKNLLLDKIRYSAFLKTGRWIKISKSENKLIKTSFNIRDNFLEIFSRNGLEGSQLAVLSALTLGYRDMLDGEINKVYSSTGAMHILSVSGLHVGILYFILALALGMLPRNRIFRIINLIIILLFLWFFAILTGLSPSVNRSAFMFSMVAIGQSFSFRTNIYNTISATAFGLLITNPANLFNLGFQLSFVAVLSIILFYPVIHKSLYFKNRVLEYTWSLISVSIAAQIGTLPLTVLYFAQFPNYFVVTNLVAIPLSTIILYLAVVLIIVSPIPTFALFIGEILNVIVKMLNKSLYWIESIPGSTIGGLHISSVQLTLLITGLFLLTVYIYSKRLIHLQLMILTIIGVILLNIEHKINIHKNKLIIFSTPKKSVVCIRNSGFAYISSLDSLQRKQIKEHEFFFSGYLNHETRNGKYKIIDEMSQPNSDIFIRKGMGLAILKTKHKLIAMPYNDSTKQISSTHKIETDILIVNQHFTQNMLNYISPKIIVIDGSFPNWKLSKLLITLADQKVKVHHLITEGAYQCEIE